MNLSENEKTTVQAASASRMNMRREARNQLVFLSAQFLLGMAVNRRPVRSRGCATGTVLSERGSGHSGRHRTASHPDR